MRGLASTDWSWTARLADFDNDGRLDAYITNGMTRNMIDSDVPFTFADQMGRTKWELYEDMPTMPQQNLAFRNDGDLQFRDVSKQWGLDHVGMSFAAATGDLDRDGDLDLVVANLDEPVSIYRNDFANGHRVLIRLRGNPSNRRGIGSIIRVETETASQIRQLIPTTGYLSSNEPFVHFGLADETTIKTLSVTWPSGYEQTINELPADRMYTVNEPQSVPTREMPSAKPPATYLAATVLQGARHVELPFDDFSHQPLLPNKLSQLGPGVAVGDVNSDGHDDLFLSGASGQSGALFVHDGTNGFLSPNMKPFNEDAECEDMASLFFDADQDGDLDLFVVSGGVEHELASIRYRDRLYLNQGQGEFSKAADSATPDLRDSGGTVAAGDFDRDGDLDLFVGGRVTPGSYPLSPESRLLRNDAGSFVDVTKELAPGICRTGMVTGAIWSDFNDDGWLDLIVTHEWGPIKQFRNNQGTLNDQTSRAGLAQLLGWWNGIAGRDIDGDQDIDYVVTNFGLNTKYHASLEHPTLLYYGDLEGQGRFNLVEAEFEGEHLFPVRGKSCSTAAMPSLGDDFSTFKAFAAATLQDIYSPVRLKDCAKFQATTLQSGVLINDGTGQMEFLPLPRLAQISPSFGVAITETGGDANPDIYVVQNFFSPQPETGNMDGGLSLLLCGNGDGSFTPIGPAESGLVVSGDAKGLAVTDLNRDGWPDFIVGTNNDRVLAFQHRGVAKRNVLTVRLAGPVGNPTAVGAKVTFRRSSGKWQTAEVTAGGGYLSQSTAELTFGWDGSQQDGGIEIRWPNGATSSHSVTAGQRKAVIEYSTLAGNRDGVTVYVPD